MEAAAQRNSVPAERAVPFFGFVWAVITVAALLCAVPLARLPQQLPDLPASFWAMAALAVVCDARPFTPARPPARARPSSRRSASSFAILLAWGLGPAIAVQAAAVAVSAWRMRHAPWRAFFNIGQYGLALSAAYGVTILAGERSFDAGGRPTWIDVAVVAAAAAAWFARQVRHRHDRGPPARRRPLVAHVPPRRGVRAGLDRLAAAARARSSSPPRTTSAALIPLVLVPLFAVYRMARLSAEQEQLARLDPLTGLANRKALLAEVHDHTPAHAERAAAGAPDRHLALLLLDLDQFKHVNDALGHAVGDRLLIEVSDRLTAAVRPADLVARLGGDEFAILARRLDGPDDARDAGRTDRRDARRAGAARRPAARRRRLDRHRALPRPRRRLRDAAAPRRRRHVRRQAPRRRGRRLRARVRPQLAGAAQPARRPAPGAGVRVARHKRPTRPARSPCTTSRRSRSRPARWSGSRRCCAGATRGAGMVDPEELIRVAEQSAGDAAAHPPGASTTSWSSWRSGPRPACTLRAAVNVSVRDLQTGEIADQITERLLPVRRRRRPSSSWRSPRAR